MMFVAMGISAVVPVLHGLQMYGYKQLEQQIGLSWLVSQGVLYVTGAAIYAVSTQEPAVCTRLTTRQCIGQGTREVPTWLV